MASDFHAHLFSVKHLQDVKSNWYSVSSEYTLKTHLEALSKVDVAGPGIVVNAYMSLFKTDDHVLDSFDEFCLLHKLYGQRFSKFTLFGILNAQTCTPPALQDLRVLGARLSLPSAEDVSVESVHQILTSQPLASNLEALQELGKPLFVFCTNLHFLTQLVQRLPAQLRLVVDHFGAASLKESDFDFYQQAFLRGIVERGAVLRGPYCRIGVMEEKVLSLLRQSYASNTIFGLHSDAPHVGRKAPKKSLKALLEPQSSAIDALSKLSGQGGEALLDSARDVWSKAFKEKKGVHFTDCSHYIGEDVLVEPGLAHVVRISPTNSTRVSNVRFVIGSGYTGVQSFYPLLFAQALSARSYICYCVEYPSYGRAGGSPEQLHLRDQVNAYAAAAKLVRKEAPSCQVVGLAWGMGCLGLFEAAATQQGLYDRLISGNGLLNAKEVFADVIQHLKDNLPDVELLQQEIQSSNVDVPMPPLSFEQFLSMIDNMDENCTYGAFQGYPLDLESTRVVLRDLAPHPGWKCQQVVGSFFKDLISKDVTRFGHELKDTPILFVHGKHNLLHSEKHARQVSFTFPLSKFVSLDGAHNDFMNAQSPVFGECIDHIHNFVQS